MKLSTVAEQMRASSTLSISAQAREKKLQGLDIIDFSAGEPDFNTPENVKNAAKAAIDNNFTHYTPYEGIPELRRAVADSLKAQCNTEYNEKQIVISNGSKHAILNAFKAILDPGDEVIVPVPYWNSYIDIIKMCYGVPVLVNAKKENGFRVRVNQLEQALTPRTKAIIINSPNNPSGMMYSAEELKEIADFAVKSDLFVLSDELYKNLVYSKKLRHISIASLGSDIYDRTIVVGGLSKSHAMTGWRVGYTASNEAVAAAIANIQSNTTSNINSVAQAAALEALTGDQTDVENMLKEFEHRRDYIAQRISDIPLLSSLLPKGAFYLFVDVSKLYGGSVCGMPIESSDDAAKALMEFYNVAVVPSGAFGCPDYIRISYATSMREIVEGSNRIERFVKDNY